MPDAKTIWLFREQLTRTGALTRLFERFDRVLHERGYLAMGSQIVDATVIEARRPVRVNVVAACSYAADADTLSATSAALTMDSFSGLSVTAATGCQLRV